MNIKFKNVETAYNVKTLTEQKIRTADSIGWALNATIEGNFNSDTIDKILAPNNTKEITVVSETTEGGTAETTILGYDKVSSCVIRHRDTTDFLEFQLTKGV
jgi:hypothetical protein